QRVLEAITTIPQLPPLTDGGRHRAADPTREADTADGVDRPAENAPDADIIPLRPWYRRTTTLIAATVVALAPLVGGVVVANRTTSSDVAAQAACVATAPDATVTRPTVGGVAAVRYAPSCGAATVDVSGIAAPPTGEQYQMWFIAGQSVTSAGLMSQDAASPESHTVTVPVTDPSAAIRITAEPAGGSAQPTSDPLWVAPIQSRRPPVFVPRVVRAQPVSLGSSSGPGSMVGSRGASSTKSMAASMMLAPTTIPHVTAAPMKSTA